MALYRYTFEHPDGRKETNVLAAGNTRAARERADRNARARGAVLVGDVEVVHDRRRSM